MKKLKSEEIFTWIIFFLLFVVIPAIVIYVCPKPYIYKEIIYIEKNNTFDRYYCQKNLEMKEEIPTDCNNGKIITSTFYYIPCYHWEIRWHTIWDKTN